MWFKYIYFIVHIQISSSHTNTKKNDIVTNKKRSPLVRMKFRIKKLCLCLSTSHICCIFFCLPFSRMQNTSHLEKLKSNFNLFIIQQMLYSTFFLKMLNCIEKGIMGGKKLEEHKLMFSGV